MQAISWSIEVELNQKNVTPDAVDEMMEALLEGGPAIGWAPNGNLSVRVFVSAFTAQEAVSRGVLAVAKAAKANGLSTHVVGIDLITEEELDRRLAVDRKLTK